MLQVLAAEMPGPTLSHSDVRRAGEAAGKKRKSAEGADGVDAVATVQGLLDFGRGDLRDCLEGKGSASDPLSFLELAQGDTRRTAAASFYQLLCLKDL
jgi:hypothetical protein